MRVKALVALLGSVFALSACGQGGSSDHAYGSTQSIARALGCRDGTTPRAQQGYDQESCTYDGARLSIWRQSHEGAAEIRVVPVWVHSVVGGAGWFVGCQQVAECERVRGAIGGVLTGVPDLTPGSAWHERAAQDRTRSTAT